MFFSPNWQTGSGGSRQSLFVVEITNEAQLWQKEKKTDEHRKQCLWQLAINNKHYKKAVNSYRESDRPPLHSLATVDSQSEDRTAFQSLSDVPRCTDLHC